MSDRELDVQMAKLMGWWVKHDQMEDRYYYCRKDADPDSYAFDYYVDEWQPSRDIAAAMLVEDRIEELGLIPEYCEALLNITDASEHFELIHASPEDRCRAAMLAAEAE